MHVQFLVRKAEIPSTVNQILRGGAERSVLMEKGKGSDTALADLVDRIKKLEHANYLLTVLYDAGQTRNAVKSADLSRQVIREEQKRTEMQVISGVVKAYYGALLSAGDGHAAQGDGEVSGTAIECPLEAAQITIDVRADLDLRMPIARTGDAWVAFGFDNDLDVAAQLAVETMLDLIERELETDRKHALALASVAVDLAVTQVVNEAKGVHAILRDGAIR